MAMNFHNPGTCQFCREPHGLPPLPFPVSFDLLPWIMHVADKLTALEAELASYRRLGPTVDTEDSAAVTNAKAVDAIMEDLKKRL